MKVNGQILLPSTSCVLVVLLSVLNNNNNNNWLPNTYLSMGYSCRNNQPIIVGTHSFICVAVCTQVHIGDNCFLGPRRKFIGGLIIDPCRVYTVQNSFSLQCLPLLSQAPSDRQLRYKEKVTEIRRKRNSNLNKEQKDKCMVM